MAAKKGISGNHIYIDKRNRYIHYDNFTKKGYLIDRQSEDKYRLYQNRFIFIVCLMVLCIDFFSSWFTFFGFFAILFVLIELVFRYTFLLKLRTVATIEKATKYTMVKEVAESKDKKKVLLKIGLYSAFGVLIIVNAYLSDFDTSTFILCLGLSFFAFYYVYINILAYFKIK